MASDPVDDLLRTLDRELDVRPAPQALARTRAAIEASRHRTFPPRWLAVSAGILIATAGAWWFVSGTIPNRDTHDVTVQVARLAGTEAPSPEAAPAADTSAAVVPPSGISRRVMPAARGGKRVNIGTAVSELAVVVSPDVKAGVDQLTRALASDRLPATSSGPELETFEPQVIVPTVVMPAVVGAGMEGLGGASESPNREFNGPLGRTGSLL